MTSKFKKRLSRLADVKDPDEGRVSGEGGEEVGIMRRCGEAKKWGRIGHGLLSFGGRHAPACR